MTLYFEKSGAMTISYDYPAGSYCSCVDLEIEYQGPLRAERCAICHCRCPNEEEIYLAVRDIEAIVELGKKWFKKMKSRIGTTRRVLAGIRDQPAVEILVARYGADAFDSTVKRLLEARVFTSEAIARTRFPGLGYDDAPAPRVEEEATRENLTECTPEKSDWELLATADEPEEAPGSALHDEMPAKGTPAEEVLAKYDLPPEDDDSPTTDGYLVGVCKDDPPAEAKRTEGTWLRSIPVNASMYLLTLHSRESMRRLCRRGAEDNLLTFQ